MRYALCALLYFGLTAESRAGSISITTLTTTWVEAGRLHAMIQIHNRGDAQASEVRADTEILGERIGSPVQPNLPPGESFTVQFSKGVDPLLRGTFPMVTIVHFQDGNRYPFTALSCNTFQLGEKVDAGLSATGAPLRLKDDGSLRFDIRNDSPQPRLVRATLHLPRELACPRPVRNVAIQARGSATVTFSVRNLSALPGAGYPVFLAQVYESDGGHFTAFSNVSVAIAKNSNWFRETRWYWTLGFVIVVAGSFLYRGLKTRTLTSIRNCA